MSKKNKNWKKKLLQGQKIEKENGQTANPKKESIPACMMANRVHHYDTSQIDSDNWQNPTDHKNTRSRKTLWYTVNGKFRCLM